MKNLYDAADVEEVKQRAWRLGPASERRWGKMTASQALAHCSLSLEWAVGDTVPERMFVMGLFGRVIKRFVLRDEEPIRRNAPTAKSLVVADERELAAEQERFCRMVDRFAAAGPAGCTRHPHSFFGRLTPDEWSRLMYKHVDHHLRQFGA